jgi:hypothetical protein
VVLDTLASFLSFFLDLKARLGIRRTCDPFGCVWCDDGGTIPKNGGCSSCSKRTTINKAFSRLLWCPRFQATDPRSSGQSRQDHLFILRLRVKDDRRILNPGHRALDRATTRRQRNQRSLWLFVSRHSNNVITAAAPTQKTASSSSTQFWQLYKTKILWRGLTIVFITARVYSTISGRRQYGVNTPATICGEGIL